MPTTIRQLSPLFSPSLARSGYGDKTLTVMNDSNLIAVVSFSAVGLLAAIGFAVLLPLSEDLAALL